MLVKRMLPPVLRSTRVLSGRPAVTQTASTRASLHAFSTSSRWLDEAATPSAADADALLMQRVKTAIKEAMKSKDTLTTTVLRSIISEHQYSQKQKGNNPASKVSKLITKAVARRKDAAQQFRNAKPPRDDLAEQEEKEAAVLSAFLEK